MFKSSIILAFMTLMPVLMTLMLGVDSINIRRRYQIEGSFNLKKPVHEMITIPALKDTGKISDCSIWKGSMNPYLAGLFWNDDPNHFMFDDQNGDFSSGYTWSDRFFNCKCRAYHDIPSYIHGPGDLMLCRTHFGDLSFLHGQEPVEGVPARRTKGKIKQWIKVMHKIYSGVYEQDKLISTIEEKRISTIIGGQPRTLGELLKCTKTNFKEKALGSTIHLIEDSYAAGHVIRKKVGTCENCGDIEMFTAYSVQSGSKHDKYDVFKGMKDSKKDMCDKQYRGYITDNKPAGAHKAYRMVVKIIKAFDRKWNDVDKVVEEIFRFVPSPKASGAGVGPDGVSFRGNYGSWKSALGFTGTRFADESNCNLKHSAILKDQKLSKSYKEYIGELTNDDFMKL